MICGACNSINNCPLPKDREQEIIKKFCRKIPKNGINSDDVISYVVFFAKYFDKNKTNELFEKNSDFGKNDSIDKLSIDELKTALQNETKVLNYLMKKHKNKRALQFYQVFSLTIGKLKEKLSNKLSENKIIFDKDDRTVSYADDNGRWASIKSFCDNLKKNIVMTQNQRSQLAYELTHIAKRYDGRNNTYIYDLNNISETVYQLITEHRHSRFLTFSQIFDEVVDKMIKNVNSVCDTKKGNQAVINNQ